MSVEHVDDVEPSWHAVGRWAERVDPEFELLPSDVWREAHHLTPPTPEYHDVDEARYHPGTNTVLLRRDQVIATVLVMTESEMDSPEGRALLQAVEAQFGPAEDSLSTDNRFMESDS